jgi:hypothetical protein
MTVMLDRRWAGRVALSERRFVFSGKYWADVHVPLSVLMAFTRSGSCGFRRGHWFEPQQFYDNLHRVPFVQVWKYLR